jgi:hypothetical protein
MKPQHLIRFGIAGAVFVLAWPAPRVCAQCEPQWLPGDGLPGIDGNVAATTVWDPDGPGPQSPLLVAGGDFAVAGDVLATHVVAWDGAIWLPLGTGTNDVVHALAVFNGELIAGGEFTTAGGVGANHVARWDGTAWQPLGSGTNHTVRALTIYNGELIAGGNFTTAGDVTANKIARWNAAAWQALDTGMSPDLFFAVYALTVHDGELIAGGRFIVAGGVLANGIARWNGAAWQALGAGVSGYFSHSSDPTTVRALAVFNGELIAGGNFLYAGQVLTPRDRPLGRRCLAPAGHRAGRCGVVPHGVQR